ncbi:MAG TPA: hypothetical protein QGH16_01440 [Verrucomicrobiota bacterium]|nr:hypothetical protein [Verrucomicrobiota bacterium]
MVKTLAKVDELSSDTTKRFSFQRNGIRVNAFVAPLEGEIFAYKTYDATNH